jgi:multidrug efflux system membrane fusion protein
VNVQLQLRVLKDAVVVPVSAVRQSGSGEYVFVLMQDRTVKQRQVVRGQMVGDRVQVVSGLQIGERVITEGADRLRDGARVMLPGDTPAQGGARQRRNAASGPAAPASMPASASAAAAAPAPAASSEERARRMAEVMKLTPEEREERRRQRREARGNATPAQ